MKNPYEILGLSKDSTAAELEARYNALKAEYGEGRFKHGKEGLIAARNLNDLEEAWRDIQIDLAVRGSGAAKNGSDVSADNAEAVRADDGAGEGAQNADEQTERVEATQESAGEVKAEEVRADDGSHASEFTYIEKLIADKKFDEAQTELDDLMDRNAEWHYLQSRIYYNREWYTECRKHLEIAIASDPDNEKYKRTLDKLDAVLGNKNADPDKLNNDYENNYNENYAQNPNAPGAGDSLLSCCATYCLLSCCCDMCRYGC